MSGLSAIRAKIEEVFGKFVPLRWRRISKGEQLSIVLLLRKPHFFTAEELRLAAERAWHTSFAGEERASMHCVSQSGTITLMKAGPHVLSFFHYPGPYVENPRQNVDWLPQPIQRQAWIEHSACVGVDYLNHDVNLELGYCVLSQLVAEMLDENCTAVYIPRVRSFIPNERSLYVELHKLGSACESGVNTRPKS